jgi:secretion/DNA translocation related TadE-like protein
MSRGDRLSPCERGSASIWVLAGSALIMLIAITVVSRTDATLSRHRAEFTADAAALAAASQIGVQTQPCAAAARIATTNGARLRDCRVRQADDGRSGQIAIVVTVDVRLPILGPASVQASANAARDPS